MEQLSLFNRNTIQLGSLCNFLSQSVQSQNHMFLMDKVQVKLFQEGNNIQEDKLWD